MYFPRRIQSNPVLADTMSLLSISEWRSKDFAIGFAKAMFGRQDGLDAFDVTDPYAIPDVLITSPVFVALKSDTDCDGTSYSAAAIHAANLAAAWEQADEYTYKILTLAEADAEDIWSPERTTRWDPRAYFMREGYTGLGASWNPWVEDDTLGTVLDHTMDDPIYSDDTIDAMNMGLI